MSEIIGNFNDLSYEDASNIARGEIPEEFITLDILDLHEFTADRDFETAGLHKRARAGIGALTTRSRDNVGIEYDTIRTDADSGYDDYDRTTRATFDTAGSTWGSNRGAYVKGTWTEHVSNSGTINEGYWGEYTEQDFLLGVFTDSEGTPSTLGRLVVPRIFEAEQLHMDVNNMYRSLGELAQRYMLEDLLLDKDEPESQPSDDDNDTWFAVHDAIENRFGEDFLEDIIASEGRLVVIPSHKKPRDGWVPLTQVDDTYTVYLG